MTPEMIIERYGAGVGTTVLAQESGRHRTTIQRILKRAGIPLRKRSTNHPYDVDFFDRHTPESCYWAGFILADGCVRSDRDTLHIKLARKDRGHLLKFAVVLGLPVEVVHDAPTRPYSYIDVCGPWFPAALARQFDITPRKTFTTTLPDIPNECLPHLVRGIFDGDGSVTLQTPPQIHFKGTVELLDALREVFYNVGVRLKSRNRVPPIHVTKQVSYSGKNALRILDWMYQESAPAIQLDRKHTRYLQIRSR